MANTVPFLVLGAAIALTGLARIAAVTVIVAVVGGIGTWLTAPSATVHIGASGLVFGFAAYLMARGIYSRRMLHLAAGVIVVVVYGSTLVFGLVPRRACPGKATRSARSVVWSRRGCWTARGDRRRALVHSGVVRLPSRPGRQQRP